MITNNPTFKLKASKSSRDLNDYHDNEADETYENDGINGDGNGDSNHRTSFYPIKDGRYKGARSRHTEFRPSRMASSERRGGYRGRGVPRRSDREYSEGGTYLLTRKYPDMLSRGSEVGSAGMYHHSKFYEAEKKNEIKFNLPEDTRISKLLRRLSIESDPDNSLMISKKLLEVLLIPDNAHYVRKAFHILSGSMLDILHVAPGPLAKQQAARALGRMGYIMAQEKDFGRFQEWMLSKMQLETDEIRFLFMKALKETLDSEAKLRKLQEYSENLMNELVTVIENTDNPEIFKAILDVLVSLVELYPEDFYSQFRDTTDLLFGWHVDHTQPLANIEFISKNLQRIAKHFQINIEFSIILICHFVDDIESYSKQLHKHESASDVDLTNSSENASIEHLTVSILALNTVLKCLGDTFNPAISDRVSTTLVTSCLMQVIKTTTDAVESFVPDNLVIAANETISLLVHILDVKTNALCCSIFTLIDLELSLTPEFSDATIISMLVMISKIIKELSANLPLELVQKLVGPNSEILKLRNSVYVDVQEAVICIYQSLLHLKNIPLLQEAYRCVLGDLELVYRLIVPDIQPLCQSNPFAEATCNEENAETTALFLLRCLSQLANAMGSIIGLWALKPSILELLAVLLEPYNILLSRNTPGLQYSLLYLLFSHSKCYNHFIASSSLVTNQQEKINVIGRLGLPETLNIGDMAGKSPNSENFVIILDVLCKALKIKTNSDTKLLLLLWLNDILLNSDQYLEILYTSEKFSSVVSVLIDCGYSFDEKIVLAVCSNLEKLLYNKQLCWSNSFLISVNDLCLLHMNSNDTEIRKNYTNLSINIPWDISVTEFGTMCTMDLVKKKCTDLTEYNKCTVILAQHLHFNLAVYSEMLPLHFKAFMRYLLKNEKMEPNCLEDIFVCCWPLDADCQTNMENFRDLALHSRPVLNNWITWEAAQLCINSKLRTPLGKPNETFTSFESALKELARDIMKSKQENGNKNVDQKRVRLLLQFMEHLEKAIYNAYEGSAIAMPQPSKPVRTFFNTNASTCREWLSRIRIVVIHIALHAGMSTIAVRHGQALLKDLLNAEKANTVEFERAVMFVTLALLNLNESEALQGLYVWCKKTSQRTFPWIKSAAEQAARRYENAVTSYKAILQDVKEKRDKPEEKDSKIPDLHVQHFISDQIMHCYKELNCWIDAVDWLNQAVISEIDDNGTRFSFNSVNTDCAKALFNLEINNHAFNQLTTWKEDDNSGSWSSYDTLMSTESVLYNIALNIAAPNNDKVLSKIDNNLVAIQNNIQDNLFSLPSEFLHSFSLMHYVSYGLKNILNNTPANTVFLVSDSFENEIVKIDSNLLSKILWWSEYFNKVQHHGSRAFSSNLRLDIIKRARKEKNFNLACTHIRQFLEQKDLLNINENGNQHMSLSNIALSFIQKSPEMSTWSGDTAKVIKEIIKLLYANDDSKQMTFNLCAAASTGLSKNAELFGGKDIREISSKILLNLANWLQTNDQISLTEITSPLGKLLMVLPDIGLIENAAANVIPMNEMAIGKLLQFSVHQCVGLAKAWNIFGAWCYRWGRKMVEHNSVSANTLTENDQLTVRSYLPPETNQEDIDKIFLILSQTKASVDEEDIDSNDINTSEMIHNQLQNVSVLSNARVTQLEALVHIWRNVQKRTFSYFELSAEAYFKYLHLASNTENVSANAGCNIITATLRLLRLIVKHALELQNVLEDGLATTPTHPWKVIIPQLFSRLNHPENYVRQRVAELLCRVAEDAPHLITFPAVVGAVEGGLKFDFSEITLPKDCFSQTNDNTEEELNEMEDADESDNDDMKNVLQACFKTMVDTLSKQAPETITQVQLLVKELRRISLLWDELWMGTLLQHHGEITKRQQQLEFEIEKVNDNTALNKEEKISLIAEKHRIIIKPIIFILEQLQAVTSVEPETPHEKQFQELYITTISEVLEKLKNPDHPDKPQEAWKPLKLLQSKFQHKVHKRTAYTLKMKDISPILANLKDTVIAMPGLASSSKTKVTISSIANHVSILPSKTKPKKLIFLGSDGQTYTYLFKGLEDLHLDERIMQFLSIANTMMAQNSAHNLYRARHYSVIPLGPRSGLISWVDGTTPAFALYKRWQQRETAKTNSKNSLTTSTTVLRPSDLFYNKLNPLLQEQGIKNIDNRKEWPLSVLKQVLTELMAETPKDLLAKELWCHSISAGEWWQTIRNYSYSVAVMSIIGYIIGLGDRHLDNVLVDLSNGELVHIDYNVCFEKGKTLRVPEKVPFRLTPNIKEALGVTEVEGIFRLACENVLKTMKKERETLLTLLEAFVYDPLIDWTVGNEGLAGTAFRAVAGNSLTRQSRKDLEREVTLAMFNVRCTEMKVEWNLNKEELLNEIPAIVDKLNKWLEEYNKMTKTKENLEDLHQQMALVKEAEAHGASNHPLYLLPARYERYCKTQEKMHVAKEELDNVMNECESHIQNYLEWIKSLENQEHSRWLIELNVAVDTDSVRIFDLVKEFLQNAGQATMITQCEQSEFEVAQLAQEQASVACRAIELLQQYGDLLSHCPTSFALEGHRITAMLKWSRYIMEQNTVVACDHAFQQYRNEYLDNTIQDQTSTAIIQFSYHLNILCKEVVAQAAKLYEEYQQAHAKEASFVKSYEDAKLEAMTFLRHEKLATKAFEFVIISDLVLLNQHFLTLETTALGSGIYLVKLTTREGGWFLDELVMNSNKVIELLNYLPLQQYSKIEDSKFLQIIKGLQISNSLYKSLQELLFSFHTVILSETMKKIQNRDQTVFEMIGDINDLIKSVGVPLKELVSQLEKHLTSVVMEMDVHASYDYTLKRIAELRLKYDVLVQSQSDNPTKGKMLLMGIHGLFDKLNVELNDLVTTLGGLEIPSCWRKLDQVKKAKELASPIFNPQVRMVLNDIFLLKQLDAMSDFFTVCLKMASSFQGNDSVVYSDEELCTPIKKFITDFLRRQFLGITTENIAYVICFLLQHLGFDVSNEIEQKDIGAENKVPLDELCQKAYTVFLKEGIFTQNILAQASGLETNLKTAWEKVRTPKQFEQKLKVSQASVYRIQNQLTAHQWLHERSFMKHPLTNICKFNRSRFLLDLQNETTALQNLQNKLKKSHEHQKGLIGSAEQRLKWAAGANPDLNEVLSAFDNAISERDLRLESELNITGKVVKICQTILQHEIIRNSTEVTKQDRIFVSALEKWHTACRCTKNKDETVTRTEESIMQFFTPQLSETPGWMSTISEKISEVITETQKQLESFKTNMFIIDDMMLVIIDRLHGLYAKHCKLIADVKMLIKSMTKIEEFAEKALEFIIDYRRYIENFSPILNRFKKIITLQEVNSTLINMVYLQEHTEELYVNLLNLETNDFDKSLCRPPLVRQDRTSTSPSKILPFKQDSTTKGQQRNAYAVGVWRRVRLKLEGKDPDPGRKSTIQEQVDYVIREATSIENLALLYEGWTPWV